MGATRTPTFPTGSKAKSKTRLLAESRTRTLRCRASSSGSRHAPIGCQRIRQGCGQDELALRHSSQRMRFPFLPTLVALSSPPHCMLSTWKMLQKKSRVPVT